MIVPTSIMNVKVNNGFPIQVLQEQSFLQRLAKVGNLSGLGRNTCYCVCIIRYTAFLQKNGPRDIGTGDFGATLDGNGSPESFD